MRGHWKALEEYMLVILEIDFCGHIYGVVNDEKTYMSKSKTLA